VAEQPPIRASALYLNVFVVAICGLVYELLAGTLGSYLLGDSVTQFSLVIGLYLSAMGVGAWLSRRLDNDLARRFLEIELAVAIVGGLSAPVLFVAFGSLEHFQIVLLAFVFAIGVLVGLELPLLMRLLEGQIAFKDIVSRVLTFDYIGALAASLMFPLVLVPDVYVATRSGSTWTTNGVAVGPLLDGFSIGATSGHGTPVLAWGSMDPALSPPTTLVVRTP
jgi:spermidine synthase